MFFEEVIGVLGSSIVKVFFLDVNTEKVYWFKCFSEWVNVVCNGEPFKEVLRVVVIGARLNDCVD